MVRSLLLLALLLTTVPAQFDAWRHSGSFFLLTTPEGADLAAAESVENFPVLVRLHRDTFDFSQCGVGGADLRFATPEGDVLAHEIEAWDPATGHAAIWLRMPRLRGNEVREVRVFWGNRGAAEGSDAAAVFGRDAGFAGVWHLDDDLRDATSNGLHGVNGGARPIEGVVGTAQRFGRGAVIPAGEAVPSLPAGNAPRTLSAWVLPESFQDEPTIGGWGKQGARRLSYLCLSHRGRVKFHGYAADPEGSTRLALGEWQHVAATLEGGTIRFYVNGRLDRTTRIAKLETPSPSPCILGRHTAASGRWARHFLGALDEVRFASVARSDAWIKLCYENQRPLQRLVGPLVRDGDALAVSPAALSLKEGEEAELTADVGGARKITWSVRRHGLERVVAVDRLRYRFRAGRTVVDDEAEVLVRVVRADGVRTLRVPVTIAEAIPEPDFSLSSPSEWNGRDVLEIRPDITNEDALAAAGVNELDYRWEVTGPAVVRTREPERLLLHRSLGSGRLTVSLSLANGGTPSRRAATIRVDEPAADPWISRVPGPDETPRDHQFFARDDRGKGTLHYNGRVEGEVDAVYLRVWAGDVVHTELRRKPAADGRYAFKVDLNPRLVRYRLSFGRVVGDREIEDRTVQDLVCGDVILIEGQSNAEAIDYGKAAHPHTSPWIRTFGSPRRDPGNARLDAWGPAVGYEPKAWKLQVGYWGMELARRLVSERKVPVCLINGASGGTRIDEHHRNDANPTDVSTIYGRLLWRLRKARLTHGVRTVIWHQGESDQGASGSDGRFGYERYAREFERLAASWKRDLPNLRHTYVFQIWPRACSMGRDGSDDRLREVQRQLPSRFSGLDVLATVGIRPPGGCHYPPEGYGKMAELVLPLVLRDLHGVVPEAPVTSPDLRDVRWADASRRKLRLTFDQPVVWDDALRARFHLDGVPDLVRSGASVGNVLTLGLSDPKDATTLTYLKGGLWRHDQPVLRGASGRAALTFCEVPIGAPSLNSPEARNRRGDRLLKAGRFDEAIADFDAYLEFEPRAEPYHWQRGIAYYYAGRYADGVGQFERHRLVNAADVENAAWHFLCKARLDGVKAAREALLPVGRDGRLPMMTVYELFAGRALPSDVERAALAAPARERTSALFYGNLYLGLYYEALGDSDAALHHLSIAANEHTVPHYMGDVARMHVKWLRTPRRPR